MLSDPLHAEVSETFPSNTSDSAELDQHRCMVVPICKVPAVSVEKQRQEWRGLSGLGICSGGKSWKKGKVGKDPSNRIV